MSEKKLLQLALAGLEVEKKEIEEQLNKQLSKSDKMKEYWRRRHENKDK